MKKIVLALASLVFMVGVASAQSPSSMAGSKASPAKPAAASCEAKAVSKDGKPLSGAAKASFMKKCEGSGNGKDAKAACADKAIDKNGKPLAGAAKTSFLKKCEADAAK